MRTSQRGEVRAPGVPEYWSVKLVEAKNEGGRKLGRRDALRRFERGGVDSLKDGF